MQTARFALKPHTRAEKFGFKVFRALVENFPRTFFVGGAVRDWLLKKPVSDIDLATAGEPPAVAADLERCGFQVDRTLTRFGVVKVKERGLEVEVTTLRTERYSKSRYPKIVFTKSVLKDARRRDFTINALYFLPNKRKIFDCASGISDLSRKIIRTVGDPGKRFTEDPLRMVRALRFCKNLGFTLEPRTRAALKKNLPLVLKLTRPNLERELEKFSSPSARRDAILVINKPALLDKKF